MSAIWSPENRYQKWLDIEIFACEAMARRGEIPKASLKKIKAKAGLSHFSDGASRGSRPLHPFGADLF